MSRLTYARDMADPRKRSLPHHIVSPATETRTVCGRSVFAPRWAFERPGIGSALCGNCARLRDSALREAATLEANR